MRKFYFLGLAGLALAAWASVGVAQIKRLTLDEMMSLADHVVYGEIVGSRVEKRDDPVDGPDLYFTTLTLQGTLLDTDNPITVNVSYFGGFIGDDGVYNSEAPSADDTKVGNKIVAFYRWNENMGGGFASDQLCAMHGGLYRTAEGPSGAVALGRGDGYALTKNMKVDALKSAVQTIRKEQKR